MDPSTSMWDWVLALNTILSVENGVFVLIWIFTKRPNI